jgi:hypothetical protein
MRLDAAPMKYAYISSPIRATDGGAGVIRCREDSGLLSNNSFELPDPERLSELADQLDTRLPLQAPSGRPTPIRERRCTDPGPGLQCAMDHCADCSSHPCYRPSLG